VLRAWSVCLRRSGVLLPLLLAAAIFLTQPAVLDGQMTGSSLGNASSPATAVAPSIVLGQVINAKTGAPVPRALVRFNSRAVLTDHEGKFRFDQNTDNNAVILVTKPGFSASTEMQEPGNLFLQAAQMAVPLELRLYPEALLTGTVLAPDGTPLRGISVTAQRSFFDDVAGHRWMNAGQEQTDSHGNFRLPVQAGDYRLETRYSPVDRTTGQAILPVMIPNDTSSNTSQTIRIHSGEEQHFELRPAVSPTHTVIAMTPSTGGREFVRISARSSNGGTLQVSPQMNGAAGETRIQLPQGTYTLTALRNNQENPEQAETIVTVPDHDISGIVLQFSPIPAIPVELVMDSSVTSDNSQPPTLPQLGLALQSDQPDPERGDSTIRPTTRHDQSFVFAAPPGSYRLQGRNTTAWYIKSASYGDSDLLQQALVVVPGAAGTPIRVTVSNQTAALQGTVNLNGAPAQCWVYLIPTGPSAQAVITLRSNNTGAYTSAHLPPGSYQAIAFERRHSANYHDPESLTPFNTYVHSITLNAGDKPTLNLDAVPVAEVAP
jgi:hypothetical protein